MSETTGSAFRYFLIEYKKRLPHTAENKAFHEHLDFMIKYFESNHLIYQKRWDDWISPNDERYWRFPTVAEAIAIKKNKEPKPENQESMGFLAWLKSRFKQT